MEKHADKFICAVRYANGSSLISKVQLRLSGKFQEEHREEVISNIEKGKSYQVILEREGMPGWSFGKYVEIVRLGGRDYLRVDRLPIESDDLGILPEY
jgi:hypothetical protein